MKISDAMCICHGNGIKIYGYLIKHGIKAISKINPNLGKYYVEVEENGIIKKSKILHDSNKELNIAVAKTYFFYADKILKEFQY